ncbi:MAG: DUF1553 domain-containing protein [Planctomycetaceae bacterium]|nr:DUF1553 domain-containing protein [Planctomycetaceae bacterium]
MSPTLVEIDEKNLRSSLRQMAAVCAFVFVVAVVAVPAIAEETVAPEPPVTAADREHWAFQPPRMPSLPAVKQPGWCRTPIDYFILAKLEAKGLTPAPPADPATLVRRLTYSLTGLPPTAVQRDTCDRPAFDSQLSALVDDLLASPAYGERWAQHWLDLARFAETDGYEHDKIREGAWRYRDWVIDALNDDLPYDRFVQLQLAGDAAELASSERDAIATGFLLAGPDMPDINLVAERRHMALNEITSTVGSVFLGLQVGCAQCHDHKYEPISQHDFYRLRAVFESAALFTKQPMGRVVFESREKLEPSRLMIRGDFRRPGPRVEPGVPRVADPFESRIDPSHRRLALARWLTRPDHPLTARLIVNRVWQEHFGYGLCQQANDFGVMGDSPTHPELLDWLALDFVNHGWSLKRLQRLIVSSAVYQTESNSGKLKAETDFLLAHFPRRRLDGEAIRDTLLMVSDRLNPERGGPGVMPPLPQELVASLLKGQWKVSADEADHRRRSVYLFARRNLRYPLFEAFDRPDAQESCPRRNRSTIAPQALVMLNSQFVFDEAQALARFVEQCNANDLEAQTKLIYQRCLAREPSAAEMQAAMKFLRENGDSSRGAERLADFCLAIFNLNEFVYID